MTRIIRELIIFITVAVVPFQLGKAVYKTILMMLPDSHLDCGESAVFGVGLVAACLAVLAYLVTRGIQFLRRNRDPSRDFQRSSAGFLRVFVVLVVAFVAASVLDGLSTSLAGAYLDPSCSINAT